MDSDLKKYLVGLCAALGATEVNLKQSSTTGATNAAGENINDNNNNATLDEVQEYVLGDEAIGTVSVMLLLTTQTACETLKEYCVEMTRLQTS